MVRESLIFLKIKENDGVSVGVRWWWNQAKDPGMS